MKNQDLYESYFYKKKRIYMKVYIFAWEENLVLRN